MGSALSTEALLIHTEFGAAEHEAPNLSSRGRASSMYFALMLRGMFSTTKFEKSASRWGSHICSKGVAPLPFFQRSRGPVWFRHSMVPRPITAAGA
jgi:hypothetical protein